MGKEELIGRILAATPDQIKMVERALSGEKAAETDCVITEGATDRRAHPRAADFLCGHILSGRL